MKEYLFNKLDSSVREAGKILRGRVDEGRKLIGGECRGFSDFRKLLDDRAVQAVVVSTPDHWHALMTMLAYRNILPGFGSPADCDPPPELDWNIFLGPAPARAYNPNRGIYHFRWFWDYSGGQMTNLVHHALDIVYWTLGGCCRW